MKTALITGINGQDGSYLADLLLVKGYQVHGIVRQAPSASDQKFFRIKKLINKIQFHVADVSDTATIQSIVENVRPDEIYHLASGHEIGLLDDNYVSTWNTETASTMCFLRAICKRSPHSKFFYASSSNIFGDPFSSPQNEKTIFSPKSVYGVSKVASMHLVEIFRSQENVFACAGILFNHESPRRSDFFLTRKISLTATKIKLGLAEELILGDLNSQRDWGFAGDYVEAMWLMLQAKEPKDYVIGTGQIHTVREVLDIAFGLLNLDWKSYVRIDPGLVRKKENSEIVADISKIRIELGWNPKMKFEELIKTMVQSDLDFLKTS